MKAQTALAAWNGVRMRKLHAGADPDAPARPVTLPADWGDEAAAALAGLAKGSGAVSLAREAARWIGPLAAGAQPSRDHARRDLAARLSELLLHRAATPDQSIWQGGAQACGTGPGFVVNLAAFALPDAGFDVRFYVAALDSVAEALRLLGGRDACVRLSNLDACLATLGLDYDSDAAREVAACLSALASVTLHPDAPPGHGRHAELTHRSGAQPALARHARTAWDQARRCKAGLEHPTELFAVTGRIESAFSVPGPEDALLGVEACGIAPVFSPLTPDGRLAASTLARLAAKGISPQDAFAASLAGESVIGHVGLAAMQAMHRAVSPFIDRVPAAPRAPAQGAGMAARHPAAGRREMPARHGGFTQKTAIGGHRLYLRTGEYEDGSLGEVTITPVREGAAQRGLMEAFSQAVSLGLQHGVPLQAFVEAFAYTRFGPQGAVEGDPTVSHATSPLDYAFRTLSQAYLGRVLPDAAQLAGPADAADGDRLLPLDLPRASSTASRPGGSRPGNQPGVRQQHGLRLVG